jgi:hypothetical protein
MEPGNSWAILVPAVGGRTKRAAPQDFIVRDANGDFYPCAPAFFEGMYEPVG